MQSIRNFLDMCAIDDAHSIPQTAQDYPAELEELFPTQMVHDAQNAIAKWDGYAATALHNLAPLAKAIGVGELHYKDESSRFGLGSFKALGGAYAVEKLMAGRDASQVTVATATDGNHGRSVAWGAQQAGCKCVIYIHAQVSKGRADAMAAYGAKIIRVDGDYDLSVRQCTEDSAKHGYEVISDTTWEGYMDVPRYVMAGYTMMVREIMAQAKAPTHIILQAGVGGLAAAITAAFWQEMGEAMPEIIIVEANLAPCLIASARSGKAETVHIQEETIMAGLSCGEASPLAWEILKRSASHFVTIADTGVPTGMRLLASGDAGPKIEAGECGLPGIIALAGIMKDETLRNSAKLDETSRVLVFGCEGATDPEIYAKVISGEIA